MDRLRRSGALATAGLAALFVLTACSGEDPAADKDPASGSGSGSGSGQNSPPAGGEGGTGTVGPGVAALDGTWTSTSDGSPVVLSVTSGKVALVADQHVCQGEVKDTGEVTLALKCLDGNTDRTVGAVESLDGDKLVVSWGTGAQDTLTRTDPDELPTGPPQAPPA
ncbi:hypothetical protein ACIRJR_04365 [Streptomyces sp. NPDC102402]|uniref:hypothetical protein n=1 Tax=Streptomyces sp. NPDC102402 TaxID=3366169 RepID=UPI0037F3B920